MSSLFERHLEEDWTPELIAELEQCGESWTFTPLAEHYARQRQDETAANYYALASLVDADIYSWLMNEIPGYGDNLHPNMSPAEHDALIKLSVAVLK